MNIIPILAKGDVYTPDEVKMIKKNIIGDAKEAGLEWFDCAKVKIILNKNLCL